jgi:hypothetical protein
MVRYMRRRPMLLRFACLYVTSMHETPCENHTDLQRTFSYHIFGRFLFPQPTDRRNCSNFWLGTSYCVRPVGNVATHSGYPAPMPGTLFPKPTPTSTSAPPPIVTDSLSAKAAGTVDDCDVYMNAFSESLSSVFGVDINSCDVWAAQAGVAVEDLVGWNPSLSTIHYVLQTGRSYCILKCRLATTLFAEQLANSCCVASSHDCHFIE